MDKGLYDSNHSFFFSFNKVNWLIDSIGENKKKETRRKVEKKRQTKEEYS